MAYSVLPAVQVRVKNVDKGKTRVLNKDGGTAVAQNVEWRSVMPGGCDTMSCLIPWDEVSSHRNVYRPGATVTVEKQGDQTAYWQGFLQQVIPNQDGTATLEALGWYHLLDEWVDNLLWQTRVYEDWTTSDSEPFEHKSYDVQVSVKPGSIVFNLPKGTKVVGGEKPVNKVDRARVIWFNDSIDVKRVAGKFVDTKNGIKFAARLERADGMAETAFKEIEGLTSDLRNESDFQYLFGVGRDIVGVVVWRTDSDTSTNLPFKTVLKIRVNGTAYRNLPGTAGHSNWDTYSAVEMVKDVVNLVGFDNGLIEGAERHANALPMWWRDQSLGDFMDYIALMEAKKWAVWPDKKVEFRRWDHNNVTWNIQGFGPKAKALVDIEPINDVYSHIEVTYRYTSGRVRRFVKKTGADLGSNRRRFFRYDLQEPLPKPNSGKVPAFVKNVADALAEEYGETRYTGTVTLATATRASSGAEAPAYNIRPGHILNVTDWPDDYPTDKKFRVYDVEYDTNGVRLTIGREPARLEQILARREHGHYRLGGRKRR